MQLDNGQYRTLVPGGWEHNAAALGTALLGCQKIHANFAACAIDLQFFMHCSPPRYLAYPRQPQSIC